MNLSFSKIILHEKQSKIKGINHRVTLLNKYKNFRKRRTNAIMFLINHNHVNKNGFPARETKIKNLLFNHSYS